MARLATHNLRRRLPGASWPAGHKAGVDINVCKWTDKWRTSSVHTRRLPSGVLQEHQATNPVLDWRAFTCETGFRAVHFSHRSVRGNGEISLKLWPIRSGLCMPAPSPHPLWSLSQCYATSESVTESSRWPWTVFLLRIWELPNMSVALRLMFNV